MYTSAYVEYRHPCIVVLWPSVADSCMIMDSFEFMSLNFSDTQNIKIRELAKLHHPGNIVLDLRCDRSSVRFTTRLAFTLKGK